MKALSESDNVLVERLLPSNGNPIDRAHAWERWYQTTGEAAVMRFIRAKNDTLEADMDILQDAMMIAYIEVERGRYQPRANIPFAAYVKGIAYNKIREARRRRRRTVPLDDTAPAMQNQNRRIEATVEWQEQLSSLHNDLSKLPACRRQVLEGYLEGRSTNEIADRLGISRASVRQHKCRGLRKLRTRIAS